MNNFLYRKIYEAHPTAAVVADEHGSERFMAGFQTYLQKHRSGQGDLFRNFTFENSKREVLLQVADVLAGSLARAIDPKKKSPRALEFLQALRSQANGIEIWPPKYGRAFQHDQASTDFDMLVREQCAGRAELFIERMEQRQSLDEVERAQLEVLRLLLFTSKFGDEGAFVSTYQLLKHLRAERLDLSTHQIRSSVVAKLRDSDVIIASGKKGYKLPVGLSDVLEFVGQAQSMVPPMLSRLSRARTALSVASLGQLDILAAAEFDELRRLIDTSQISV